LLTSSFHREVSAVKNSRSIEEILKDIREAYLEEQRSDDARSGDINAAVIPTWSPEETRWDIDKLTVVWPSPGPKR
jgi:hypothetical protein